MSPAPLSLNKCRSRRVSLRMRLVFVDIHCLVNAPWIVEMFERACVKAKIKPGSLRDRDQPLKMHPIPNNLHQQFIQSRVEEKGWQKKCGHFFLNVKICWNVVIKLWFQYIVLPHHYYILLLLLLLHTC